MNNYKLPSNSVDLGKNTLFYRGYLIRLDELPEDDNLKMWHAVIFPDGSEMCAPISPYEFGFEAVVLWIDVGMPPHLGGANWHLQALKEYEEELKKLKFFRFLTQEEEEEFKKDARDKYVPYTPIQGYWHPVYQHECVRINEESASQHNLLTSDFAYSR